MQILLSNILAFLFVVGVIIFVHEAGHYIVGRLFGVRVLTFSLGFGNRIWGFRRGDTDFRISLVPLGGYVAFAGRDPTASEQRPDDFLAQPRWQRILIYLAGPGMNVLLAVALVAGVFMSGTRMVNEKDLEPVVGGVPADSAGARAGLASGDRLLTIDGEPVEHWQQVSMTILTSPGRALAIEYERNGKRERTELTPDIIPKYKLGMPTLAPPWKPQVVEVVEGRPAALAGFAPDDILVAVDRQPVFSLEEFTQRLQRSEGPVVVEVERDGRIVPLEVRPERVEVEGSDEERAQIGVVIGYPLRRMGFVEALRASVRYNLDTVEQIGQFIGKVFERRISPESAIGGPLEIGVVSGDAARRGMKELLFLMALISLNLFLINMLPIPIMDGGEILILLIESILRRDLSLMVKERLIQVGLVFIVTLMAMAMFFDVRKRLPGDEGPLSDGAVESVSGGDSESAPEADAAVPETEDPVPATPPR